MQISFVNFLLKTLQKHPVAHGTETRSPDKAALSPPPLLSSAHLAPLPAPPAGLQPSLLLGTYTCGAQPLPTSFPALGFVHSVLSA